MAKRKTFYVSADLFGKSLSPHAIAVYCYLSYCSNRDNVSFPAVGTIAEACGMSVCTARRAIKALCDAGMLEVKSAYRINAKGHRQRMTNHYTVRGISGPPIGERVPSLSEKEYPPITDRGEINDNGKSIMGTPSFLPTRERRRDWEQDAEISELNGIVMGLELELYRDRHFARAVDAAIRTMFHADAIRVRGRTIPQSAVRAVLHMLTIDHIDFVEQQLRDGTEEVASGTGYLISCLYNAPMDMCVRTKHAYGI